MVGPPRRFNLLRPSSPVSQILFAGGIRCAIGSINMSLKVFMVPVKGEFVAGGENSFSPSQRSAHDGVQIANPCQLAGNG